MADLETCVNLYVVAAGKLAALRQAEADAPIRLIGELRQRRLKPHVDSFISAYQRAVRVTRATYGDHFAEMEVEANALAGPITAKEAEQVLGPLRVWLETRDV